MLISCALFAGATHAWFSDRCSAQIKLQSATFNVGVEISPENGTSVTSTENGIYVYNLSHGTYTVKLTRVSEGTVGYCEITVGDVVYYSPNLTEAGFSFDLTITLPEGAEPVSVTFTPVWSDVTKVEGVTTIDSETPISYSAVPQLNAMRAGSVEAAGQGSGESDNDTGDLQTGTDNSAVDNSGSEGEPTGNGNLPGGEPTGSEPLDPETGETAGVGDPTGEDTPGSDTGNVLSGGE